ncbi:T9SS type A sorting domain-containing protein [Winogradskyella undariae]|uniref:fibronectin type III domain-containing protein n=1 Tax=Winogradskyella undariae TaxID=1285465 RepID=UPI00156B2DBF|nr:fibronectin type III domain-containing protein [Winogradskyella undariae]NRR92349.1 T9SS type A sorting domain-containing protein [Winogradskyella undariae]
MKKITLMLFVLVTFCWQSNAQVQIGDGTNQSQNLPINPYFGYSYSQTIYTSNQINANGTITDISYQFDGNSTIDASKEWTVFIGYTTKTEFTSNTDWVDVSTLTQVFEGTITVVGAGSSEWINIDITDFNYNGTDNLVIAVNETAPNYDGSGDDFLSTAVSSVQSIVSYRDSSVFDPASPETASQMPSYIPNIILNGINQTCPVPSDLTVTDITTTTAGLAWTENGSATSYNIEVLEAGEAATGTATDTGIANGFTKTGLTSGTSYFYYVQADCTGGDLSGWAGPFTFATDCELFTVPYSENFDLTAAGTSNNSTVPNCWSFIDGGLGYGYVNSTDGNSFYMYNSYDSSGDYILVSPQTTDLSSGDNRVRFDLDGSLANEFIVGTLTDPSDPTTFTEIETVTLLTSDYESFIVNIPAGTDMYLGFKHGQTADYKSYNIDNIVVEPIPSCLEASDLSATNITTTTADLSWTENGTTSLYNVEVVVSGEVPTGTATDVSVASGFTKSGLTETTVYQFYVQADCTGGDLSIWVGPFEFETPCEAISVDYTADMSSNVPDLCWEEAGIGEVIDGPSGFGASDWKSGRAFTTDNGDIIDSNVINLYDNDDREWLVSPSFDLDAMGAVALLVKVAVTDYRFSGVSTETDIDVMGSDDEVQLLMTSDDGVTWTNITTWNVTNQPLVTGTDYLVDLSSMVGSVKFAFFASDGETNDSFDYDFHVGVFEVSNAALSVNDFESEATFTYYPNPVKNTLTLNAQNTIEQVAMYNMLGQEVLRATPNTVDSDLDMSNLQTGTYFVRVTIGNVTETIKVIKQ